MFTRSQRLFGAFPFRVIGGDVDDGNRFAAVVAHERRLHEHIDARAVRAAPHHVLFEDAAAVEKLARGLVAVALDDETNVRARE